MYVRFLDDDGGPPQHSTASFHHHHVMSMFCALIIINFSSKRLNYTLEHIRVFNVFKGWWDEMLRREGCYNYDEDQDDDDDKVEILHMPDIPESRILSIHSIILYVVFCMCTVSTDVCIGFVCPWFEYNGGTSWQWMRCGIKLPTFHNFFVTEDMMQTNYERCPDTDLDSHSLLLLRPRYEIK